ncbi:carboxypeptidase-like regulatory domain-containing protein [Flammeovirga sp. OC4]|uniref:carboxypeptidase-like regulatory domain-containing protein n=1 Tax=Flammeovirga sp. OC4 TaxID=1382345 RepID=UPI0005C48568|nr:carboxypeptidase-like regulatory domain-containing protein [Flammeovirga sp. OC4]
MLLNLTIKRVFILLTFSINIGKLYSQNISPQFLQDFDKIIEGKRIVLLGEMSHREGNVIQTNTELVKYLHEQRGYNLILFESGFIDLGFIPNTDTVSLYRDHLSDAILPIWSQSEEFQPLLDFLTEKKNTLKVGGFDLQFSSGYMYSNFTDTLRHFITKNKEEKWEKFFYIFEDVVNEGTYPSKAFPLPLHLAEIKKLKKLVNNDFIEQGLENYKQYLLMLKSDVYEVEENDFKAEMSNPRDLQMAKNVIYYANKYPEAKIICWGASGHFANDFSSFENEEIKAFKPMGGEVIKELKEEVINIGYTVGGGSYKAWFEDTEEANRIALNSLGQFESYHYKKDDSLSIIDLHSTSLKDSLFTTSLIEYTRLKGKWAEVFDAIIFQKEVTPMHTINVKRAIAFDTSFVINNYPILQKNRIIKKRGRYKRGKVVDRINNEPISYCLLKIKGTNQGTVCDENGQYELAVNKGDTILLSSSGYEKKEIVFDGNEIEFKLSPSTVTLNEITIFSEGDIAKQIFKKAIENLDKNYDLDPNLINFYTYQTVHRNGIKKLETEYCGEYYFSFYPNKEKSRITQTRFWVYEPVNNWFRGPYRSHYSFADQIQTHPIFHNGRINKYKFELIENPDHYVIKFYPKNQKPQNFKVEETFVTIDATNYAILEIKTVENNNIEKFSKLLENTYKKFKQNEPINLHFSERILTTIYNKNYQDKYEVIYSTNSYINKGVNTVRNEKVEMNSNMIYIPYSRRKVGAQEKTFKKEYDHFWDIKYNKDFWENFSIPKISPQDKLIY